MSDEPAFDTRFAELRVLFLERVDDELNEITALMKQSASERSLPQLRSVAHRLNGSSAMLGFEGIHVSARQMEHWLRATERQSLTEVHWQELQQLVAALDGAVQASRQPQP